MGGLRRAWGTTAALAAALSGVGCSSAPPHATPTPRDVAVVSPMPVPRAQPLPLPTPTTLSLPDGACPAGAVRLDVALAASTVHPAGVVLATATLHNTGTRTCDYVPECPTDVRIDAVAPSPGVAGETSVDCMAPPGYVVLAPGQVVANKLPPLVALKDPGRYVVTVSWGIQQVSVPLTVTP